MIQILVKFNNNTIMTSKLKDVLKQYQVPLLHGTHGSGKTTLVRIFRKLSNARTTVISFCRFFNSISFFETI